MNFSTNQVLHLYVVEGSETVTYDSNTGSIVVKKGNEVLYRTPEIGEVLYTTKKAASDLKTPLMESVLTLDAAINGGNPVSGEDYMVKVSFPLLGGVGPEAFTTRTAAVHATSDMTADKFYAKLAVALAKTIGEDMPIEVYVDSTLITKDTKESAISGATSVTIRQTDPSKFWRLGITKMHYCDFTVSASPVIAGGEYVIPFAEDSFKLKKSTVLIPNSKVIADMEYFALGERGDQYRMMGYPNIIPTEYKVNPNSTNGYSVTCVHCAMTGSNESVQKAEKDIMFVKDAAAAVEITDLA